MNAIAGFNAETSRKPATLPRHFGQRRLPEHSRVVEVDRREVLFAEAKARDLVVEADVGGKAGGQGRQRLIGPLPALEVEPPERLDGPRAQKRGEIGEALEPRLALRQGDVDQPR